MWKIVRNTSPVSSPLPLDLSVRSDSLDHARSGGNVVVKVIHIIVAKEAMVSKLQLFGEKKEGKMRKTILPIQGRHSCQSLAFADFFINNLGEIVKIHTNLY